ncbi:hypothetical protein [Streptomyces sp. NPDC020996]|uniref:hypothetical protein n=1 Tax=Streptomyces sp. NPDC020996 TaxID=3154791 RepID=UPI0033C0D04C
MHDIFACARDGERWTDRWYVFDRSVQVGDTVFVADVDEGVLARRRVVAAEPGDQVRGDEGCADLSAAYCRDLFDVGGDAPFVRFDVDSATEPFDAETLSLVWPAGRPECAGLTLEGVRSGGPVEQRYVPALTRYWEEHVDRLLGQGNAVRLTL